MTEEQNDTEKKGPDFCADMPFAETMRKMMGNRETASSCCPEMMFQMMSKCFKTKDKREDVPKS